MNMCIRLLAHGLRTLCAQGEDNDEVQNQPAWLQEDGATNGPSDDGASTPSPAPHSAPGHERGLSNGAADFIGLDGSANGAVPYANGDAPHAPHPQQPDAPAPASEAPAPPRNPLDDLLSLSPAQQPPQPPPRPGAALGF
jgi:hypothetical protein